MMQQFDDEVLPASSKCENDMGFVVPCMYFLVSGRSIPFIFVPEMKANERDCSSNEH
jgi:hypothetical protein